MKITPGSEAVAKAHTAASLEPRLYCVGQRCGWMGPESRALWRAGRPLCPECLALTERLHLADRRAA